MPNTSLLVSDFDTQLFSAVSAGDTSAILLSATDDDGNALPNGVYALTTDGSSLKKEYVLGLLTGTTITNVQHVSRQGVLSTGFANDHRTGAKVTITDWAVLSQISNLLNGTTGLDPSIHLKYSSAPSSLTGNELATVAYVLSVVNGGTVSFDQQVANNQTLGETEAVNDLVYFKEADARWWKADADLTATFDQLQLGITKTAGNAGQSATIAISGPVSGFTGLTPGSKYYLSNTAGAITTTPGTNSVFIGWALSTTSLLFSPYFKTLPTQNQKNAMVGTVGTPSSTNPFVTAAGTSAGAVDQSQTTQNSTQGLGLANTFGNANKIAQSFVATKTILRSVSLYKSADTGTFTGTVTISIQADAAAAPSGTPLVTKTITNALWSAYSVGEFLALFASELTISPNVNTYWIVIETSTADNANHPNIGINTAGGYGSGLVKSFGASIWATIATIDLYFKINEGFNGKSIDGDANGLVPAVASKLRVKTANISTSGGSTTIVHGFGKVPAIIRATSMFGSTSAIETAQGTYDVANAVYTNINVLYDEGTTGAANFGVSNLLAGNTHLSNVNVSGVDENIVLLSGLTGPSSVGYIEIIG